MDNIPSAPQYGGPTTTANSAKEGRLKVDTGKGSKNIILRKILRKGRKKNSA